MLIAVVPAYNEEKSIGGVIRSLFLHADAIVVVDDGSRDATGAVAQDAGAHVIRHAINRGQGAALATGHAYALENGADYVVHFDADGQFDAEDIRPALSHMQENKADVLLGSRFLDSRSTVPWVKRRIFFPIARMVNGFSGAVPVSDAHNGFRILNRKALESIQITHDGMAHATEILTEIRRHGLEHVEYPVKVVYHEYGRGFGEGVRVVRDLVLGRFIKNPKP